VSANTWEMGRLRLYQYYAARAVDRPSTMEEMIPLLAAVSHGCKAGQYLQVFDEIYTRRINRGGLFLRDHLGAVGADLSALAQFFEEPWLEPAAALVGQQRAKVLSQVGLLLGLLGRVAEAEEPLLKGLEAFRSLDRWDDAAVAARHVSRYYLTRGAIAEAQRHAHDGVELASMHCGPQTQVGTYSTLADVLHQAGHLRNAELVFQKAEAAQRQCDARHPLLTRLHGFRRFEVLLSQGKHDRVITEAQESLEYPEQKEFLLGRALHRLTLGAAHMARAIEEGARQFSAAEAAIDTAVTELRQAQQARHIPSGLFVRAQLRRLQGRFAECRQDLDEMKEIAHHGNMMLHLGDYWLESGRLYLAERDFENARRALDEARQLVLRLGYERHRHELCAARALLSLVLGEQQAATSELSEARTLAREQGFLNHEDMLAFLDRQLNGFAQETWRAYESRTLDDIVQQLTQCQATSLASDAAKADDLAEALMNATRSAYDRVCREYATRRGDRPHSGDRRHWKAVADRLKARRDAAPDVPVTILDVGTAFGRDIEYATALGFQITGIDNSWGFIDLLRERERKREIPSGSYLRLDMRDLQFFASHSFDFVRHNASLVHMPVIGPGFSVDLALSETRRVLKHDGLVYVSVKQGPGLKIIDSGEGFGPLAFQLYTDTLLKAVLARNEFRIVWSDSRPSSRGSGASWLAVIAAPVEASAHGTPTDR